MLRRGFVLVLALAGCVIGFRGEGTFFGEHALDGVDTLRIELPSTPIVVNACDATMPAVCPELLSYEGRWMSTGGTRSDAEAATTRPSLRLDRDGAFAALRAVIPLSVRGLVDLQMEEIVLPDDRDLDVRTGLGDVTITGSRASVVVDVEIGDVTVRGADAGLGVRTGLGDIDVESSGHVDLRTEEGRVEVVQTGAPRDVVIRSGDGGIVVELADDADVDLRIRTPDTIEVRTSRLTTITSGQYDRRLGTGMVLVDLRTDHGRVEVVEREQ
jgi:hypothetical protein